MVVCPWARSRLVTRASCPRPDAPGRFHRTRSGPRRRLVSGRANSARLAGRRTVYPDPSHQLTLAGSARVTPPVDLCRITRVTPPVDLCRIGVRQLTLGPTGHRRLPEPARDCLASPPTPCPALRGILEHAQHPHPAAPWCPWASQKRTAFPPPAAVEPRPPPRSARRHTRSPRRPTRRLPSPGCCGACEVVVGERGPAGDSPRGAGASDGAAGEGAGSAVRRTGPMPPTAVSTTGPTPPRASGQRGPRRRVRQEDGAHAAGCSPWRGGGLVQCGRVPLMAPGGVT